MTRAPLPFFTRLWFAFAAYFRVLFDGAFAARVHELAQGSEPDAPGLEPAPEAKPTAEPKPEPKASPIAAAAIGGAPPEALDGALQLLALLQREGRFLDFVQQDVASFGDADVGAVARIVHSGCRKALGSHARIVSVRTEAEGTQIVVDHSERDRVKLTGEVSGSAPYRGVLRHRGWQIETLKLPQRVGTQDLRIVAPAEVEL